MMIYELFYILGVVILIIALLKPLKDSFLFEILIKNQTKNKD